jgi:hypothetical protein
VSEFYYRQQAQPVVAISGEALRDSQRFDTLIAKVQRHILDEMIADMEHGPRLGPRKVLNDEQQAEKDHHDWLVSQLEAIADEWGINLHEGCDEY